MSGIRGGIRQADSERVSDCSVVVDKCSVNIPTVKLRWSVIGASVKHKIKCPYVIVPLANEVGYKTKTYDNTCLTVQILQQ